MLSKVKNNLRILGNYDDKYLLEIIERGKSRLNNLTGVELDYLLPDNEELLLNFCRYEYNNVSEWFEDNFREVILRKQIQIGIEAEKEGS